MHTLEWKAGVAALVLGAAVSAAAQSSRGTGRTAGGDIGLDPSPAQCAGLDGPGLMDCVRAYETLNGGTTGTAGDYGGAVAGTYAGAAAPQTPAMSAATADAMVTDGTTRANPATPGAATTLRIDTRNTGVDLGLTRAADGTPVPKHNAMGRGSRNGR